MDSVIGLGPLLDPGALWKIARNVWSVRDRLHIRTGQNLPTVGQLAVALRLYIQAEDQKRIDACEHQIAASRSDENGAMETPRHPSLSSAEIAESCTAGGRSSSSDDALSTCNLKALAEELTVAHPRSTQSMKRLSGASCPAPSHKKLATDLRHYLVLAESAYSSNLAAFEERLLSIAGRPALLEAMWNSSKYNPAYCMMYDNINDAIVVAVRGSKEPSDFLTNLSCETDPFLSGYGHSGMVQSARNVAANLKPSLYTYLAVIGPRNGVIFVGHSLGGAIAAILAIMCRTQTLEENAALGTPAGSLTYRQSWNAHERNSSASTSGSTDVCTISSPERVSLIVSQARCFTFGCPPCVSPDIALNAKHQGVTSVILGLDIVPRLSIASVDRLLLSVSRYDWSTHASRAVETHIASVAAPLLGTAGAATAAALITKVGPSGLAWATDAVGSATRRVLTSQPSRGAGSGSSAGALSTATSLSPAWKVALTVTAVASSVISHQFFQEESAQVLARSQGNRREPVYNYARHFGISADDIDRALLSEPDVLHVPGRIVYLDRPFVTPAEYSGTEKTLPPVRILERDPNDFLDVEASTWMLHDHNPHNMILALDSIE